MENVEQNLKAITSPTDQKCENAVKLKVCPCCMGKEQNTFKLLTTFCLLGKTSDVLFLPLLQANSNKYSEW